ncbi:N-acetylmuramoyl-L-alanine amidase [Rhodococcus sp. NPDC003318]|uniref:N-acetylmuramoyl-L-alanine amidase n=1 Tax=Rhodococcus sp. NPDC003318 TaxID=3364503 RepID=UPI003686485C
MTRSGLAVGVVAVAATALLVPMSATADPAAGARAAGVAAPIDPLAGKKVFLDPGHQGTGHSEDLSRQVDDGRGGTKDCQTTGMTTLGGVPEHTITWDVAQLVKAGLENLGATVELSRQDDTGWGGCVDERARAAGASGADLAVSIHADSTTAGEDTTRHGFHLIVPTLPIPDPKVDEVQSGAGRVATEAIRDAYVEGGFTPANYAGVVDGIQTRDDIAGPALTTVPLAFVEMGNGSNPDDAAVLESQNGRLEHAVAIIVGAVDYLMGAGGTDAAAATTPTTTAPTTTAAPARAADTPATTTPAAPVTTTAPAGQDLGAIGALLDALGLGGVADLVDAEDLGDLVGLLSALLDLVGAQG